MPLERAGERRFPDIVRLMAPRPGRFELATRLAVICALTVLIVEIYQTPDAALTVYVVYFLNRENRAVSLILNVVLLISGLPVFQTSNAAKTATMTPMMTSMVMAAK